MNDVYLSTLSNIESTDNWDLPGFSIFLLFRMNEAQNRPRREYTPKAKPVFDFDSDNQSTNGGYTISVGPPPSRNSGKTVAHATYCICQLIEKEFLSNISLLQI